MGGYSLAWALHVSGPIAVVVAGLLIGNHGRSLAMSEEVADYLETFWELIDEILNAILFLLIGVEVLVITFTGERLLAGLIIIGIVLFARFISVLVPISVIGLRNQFPKGVVTHPDLGGTARRHLGGPGAVPAAGARDAT